MKALTDDQCREIISEREVPDEIRNSASRVAVVFTQSWCGDWRTMRRYLPRLSADEAAVYYVEYDRRPFFDEMREFKETVFGNALLPYVRYYRGGEFVNESNLVFFRRGFLKRFGG